MQHSLSQTLLEEATAIFFAKSLIVELVYYFLSKSPIVEATTIFIVTNSISSGYCNTFRRAHY